MVYFSIITLVYFSIIIYNASRGPQGSSTGSTSRSWPWRPSRRSGSSGGGVEKAGFDSFQTLAGTIYDRYDEVLNFFNDRSTNASAEAFNSKVKNFRAALRGVSDISFLLFRLQKIYA